MRNMTLFREKKKDLALRLRLLQAGERLKVKKESFLYEFTRVALAGELCTVVNGAGMSPRIFQENVGANEIVEEMLFPWNLHEFYLEEAEIC